MKEIDKAEKRLEQIEKKLENENIFGHINGKDFSLIMHDLLIPEGEYVTDIGNWENVNYVCIYDLIYKIKRHPLIWKLFFMI